MDSTGAEETSSRNKRINTTGGRRYCRAALLNNHGKIITTKYTTIMKNTVTIKPRVFTDIKSGESGEIATNAGFYGTAAYLNPDTGKFEKLTK